jgi:hypothetical protein
LPAGKKDCRGHRLMLPDFNFPTYLACKAGNWPEAHGVEKIITEYGKDVSEIIRRLGEEHLDVGTPNISFSSLRLPPPPPPSLSPPANMGKTLLPLPFSLPLPSPSPLFSLLPSLLTHQGMGSLNSPPPAFDPMDPHLPSFLCFPPL